MEKNTKSIAHVIIQKPTVFPLDKEILVHYIYKIIHHNITFLTLLDNQSL